MKYVMPFLTGLLGLGLLLMGSTDLGLVSLGFTVVLVFHGSGGPTQKIATGNNAMLYLLLAIIIYVVIIGPAWTTVEISQGNTELLEALK